MSKKINSLVIGAFESVHKGHIKLIEKAIKMYGNTLILIIDLSDLSSNFYNIKQIEQLLKPYGKTKIFKLDKTSIKYTPEEFITKVLMPLKIKNIVIGSDFNFGFNKTGSSKNLKDFFNVTVVSLKSKKISTSKISSLLKNEKVSEANKMLTTPYFIEGKIINGKKLASKLGYPTANIDHRQKEIKVADGVYKTNIVIDKKKYKSITFVGIAKDDETKTHKVETHIFDFQKNIYGKNVKVEFIKFIRRNKKFEKVSDLIEQIKKDILLAK